MLKGIEVKILPASLSLANFLDMIKSLITKAEADVPVFPKYSLNMLDIQTPFSLLSLKNSMAIDFKVLEKWIKKLIRLTVQTFGQEKTL